MANVRVPPFDEAPSTVVGSTPQTSFSFSFPFWESADIEVYVDGVLLDAADYTVEGLAVQDGLAVEGGYGSGTVTLDAAVSNVTVTIDRKVVGDRETQFSRSAPLGMSALNADLNRVTARQQDLERHKVTRPMGERAGLFLAFDADGNEVASSGTGTDNSLRTDLAAPAGAALVGVAQSGTGAATRSLRSKARDLIDVRDFGVTTSTSNEYTAEIQAALDEAESSDRASVMVNEFYQVAGSLSLPGGISLVTMTGASEYYANNPFSTARSAGLYKPADGDDGPLVIVHTGSTLDGLYLRHEKVGGAQTGVVQMGEDSPTSMIFNALVKNCRINGHAINENTNVWQDSDCRGIWFPHGTLNTGLRYFNKVNNNWLANFDMGIRLGDQANGNSLVGNHTRQIYRHYVFDGGATECVSNVVEAALMANQGFLPTNTPYCVTLIGSVSFLKFGGVSEQNGKAFDISGYTGGTDLDFGGFNPNEVSPSYPPIGSIVRGFAPVKSADGGRQLLLPNSTAETRYEQGQGNKIERFELVTGTLPQLGGAGALVASDPDSRRIVTFNDAVYSKAARTSFSARLKVFVCSTGGGTGEHLVEVDFVYRVTDQATNAAELSVKSVRKSPSSGNYVAGLYFLDGVAAGGNFAIAMTGGNLGAFEATHVAVDLEITALTHTTNSVALRDLADLSFVSAACTANDVTDANDLLTVADIVI